MRFRWPIRVYYEDTDAGGVVYYANYLRFLERARTEWLRHLGYEQDALMRDPGILFAVRRVELDYLRPARFNEALEVVSEVTRIGGASIDFAQQVLRTTDAAVLCRGTVRVACIAAADMRPARIPDDMKRRLQQE
ncbi:MAG TPA: tol-pal system-associated acyl-CoA thioesterase [Gammaproteobacteria bacterium]|nr:tol-pal system-associated acyl-CoA thioesterase [Gammaproteobacteria bacterium]